MNFDWAAPVAGWDLVWSVVVTALSIWVGILIGRRQERRLNAIKGAEQDHAQSVYWADGLFSYQTMDAPWFLTEASPTPGRFRMKWADPESFRRYFVAKVESESIRIPQSEFEIVRYALRAYNRACDRLAEAGTSIDGSAQRELIDRELKVPKQVLAGWRPGLIRTDWLIPYGSGHRYSK